MCNGDKETADQLVDMVDTYRVMEEMLVPARQKELVSACQEFFFSFAEISQKPGISLKESHEESAPATLGEQPGSSVPQDGGPQTMSDF